HLRAPACACSARRLPACRPRRSDSKCHLRRHNGLQQSRQHVLRAGERFEPRNSEASLESYSFFAWIAPTTLRLDRTGRAFAAATLRRTKAYGRQKSALQKTFGLQKNFELRNTDAS